MVITENPFLPGNSSIKVASRFMKFLIVADCTGMTAAQAQAAIKTATFEIEKVSRDGNADILKVTSLLDLLEVGTNANDGAVRVITSGGNTKIKGTVNIGFDGDIDPLPNESYTLRVKDLPADCKITINSLETRRNAQTRFDYQKAKGLKDVATPIEIAGTHLLALPKANLVKLELTSPTNEKLTLLPDEIEQHLSEMNTAAFNINGAITPVGLNYFTFPVGSSIRAHVTYTEDTTVMLVNVISVNG
ncbi:hypothetical protein [Sediminibacterium ginsengisoli]|uniref:Uncharacterized protein n=1 Tax=Sediminibacterium ginsengisoli TaxID=413434 RepID=A0A1T4RZL9_9BACT|nr:hypothetical protein [Sediminibacterium ginsengisoli]SKA21148.1 hypothetical protein SAMN04488132_1172 [Sediminibacterium ginsengisoli]